MGPMLKQYRSSHIDQKLRFFLYDCFTEHYCHQSQGSGQGHIFHLPRRGKGPPGAPAPGPQGLPRRGGCRRFGFLFSARLLHEKCVQFWIRVHSESGHLDTVRCWLRSVYRIGEVRQNELNLGLKFLKLVHL